MKKVEANKTYLGVVEDNNDPKKIGRVRVRVMNVFDDIEKENLPWAKPWKDLNGNSFNIPDVGKVVTVIFESENIYSPEYIYADHYNANLEKKLSELSESDYLTMKSLIFDHKTQIYVNDTEGLKMDHKFNVINVREKSINLNLKDNFGKINIGTENSTQRAILGDHFLNWFDDLVNILLGDKGGPFLGNLGAPVIPTPTLMGHLQLYQQLKVPKFLSKHVSIVDNESVKKLNRVAEGQKGDTWQSTKKENDLVKQEPVPFTPTAGATDTTFEQPSPNTPVVGTQSDSAKNATQPGQAVGSTVTDTAPLQAKPKPAEHPDVAVLLEIMRTKNYKIYSRENEMNIIAVRNQCLNPGEKYTDEFTDELFLLYKTKEGYWEVKKFNFSTVPGLEFTITRSWIQENYPNGSTFWEQELQKNEKYTMKKYYSVGERFVNSPYAVDKGLNILIPSQYIDAYEISTYRGAPAMNTRQGAVIKVWVDTKFTQTNEFLPYNLTKPETITQGVEGQSQVFTPYKFGIHLGYPGGKKVGFWSQGSQVFPTSEELNEFFATCNLHKSLYGNKFTYTLVTRPDVQKATKNVEIDRANNKPLISPVPQIPTTTQG